MHRIFQNIPLFRTFSYLKRYALPFWTGISGLLLARVFEGAIPYFVKLGIDRITLGSESLALGSLDYETAVAALTLPCLALAFCVLMQTLVTAGSRILVRRIGVEAASDLRDRLYDHLQQQGPMFFVRYSIGDLMARAINDIQLIRIVLAGTVRMTLVICFTLLVGLVFMFSLSWKLTLALLLPMPAIALAGYVISSSIYGLSYRVQAGFSDLSTFVQENLNGIRTVQAMAQEEQEMQRFAAVNQDYLERNLALFQVQSMLGAIMPVLAGVGMLIILGYGSWLLGEGEVTLGTLAAFFSYLGLILWPMREAGTLISQWQRGASGAARLYEILDHEPEIREQSRGPHPRITGHIEIRHLSYQYEGKDKYALHDIHLNVDAGETVAILGRVGSGKSTLLRLLVRLLDPGAGQILLDGHPINYFPLNELRDQVCMVLQDPFLFADSLGDNIRYDDPGRSEESVRESADAAALGATISELPEQLNTLLGERGVNLSGGQKQRTTLARGLIRSAPILILDDCFSAVDTQTEEAILSMLRRLREGLTTILVSHRVSTARHADKIIVLEEGEMIESGSHRELLAAGGFYAELERTQSAGARDLDRVRGAKE